MKLFMGYDWRMTGGRKIACAVLTICVCLCAVPVRAQQPSGTRDVARPVRGRVGRSVERVRRSVRQSTRIPRDRTPPSRTRGGRQYGAEFKRRFERNFRVSPQPNITVRNEFGRIRIRPWNKNQVRVRADITARAPEAARARRLAQDTQVDVQVSAGRITIKTRYPDTQRSDRVLLQSDYDVSVPAMSNLHLENRFGDIEVKGIHGKIESVCSHGHTRLEALSGELNVVSENGNVVGRNLASDTRVEAQFGRVDLQDVSGSITVHSRYAPVAVRSASTRSETRIVCDSADIELTLPADADPNMYVHTTFGEISSDIPLKVQSVGNNSTARRVSASPQRVDLTSSMGNVAVRLTGKKDVAPAPDVRRPLSGEPEEMLAPGVRHDEIQLAPGSKVRIEDARGDIRIAGWDRNVLGVAAMKTGRAEVKVERMPDGTQVARILRAETQEGVVGAGLDIKVPQKAALEVTNSHGDIVIDSVDGMLSISNDHGNIKVMNLTPVQRDCSLQCTDGSISILIPPGSNIEISATVEDGSIDSAIPLQGQVGRHNSSLRGKLGDGRTRVELKATHGRIVIN